MKFIDTESGKEFNSFFDAFDSFCCRKTACHKCPFKNYESCSEWEKKKSLKL